MLWILKAISSVGDHSSRASVNPVCDKGSPGQMKRGKYIYRASYFSIRKSRGKDKQLNEMNSYKKKEIELLLQMKRKEMLYEASYFSIRECKRVDKQLDEMNPYKKKEIE